MSITNLLLLTCVAVSEAEPVHVLDARKQLFLDDHLIASKEGVARTLCPVAKHPANPVLWPSESWEGSVAIVYGSVLKDAGKYRMWYHGGIGVSYAESNDGIHWTRPRLDLVPIAGNKTNVLFRRDPQAGEPAAPSHYYEIFGVHRDDGDPDPQRRYKMGYLSIERQYKGPSADPFHSGQRRGLGVAGSPDGLRWKTIDDFASDAICDGATHWMHDSAKDCYVVYGRTKSTLPDVQAAWSKEPWFGRYHWGRAVARISSPDFLTWDHTKPASAPVVLTADLDDRPVTEIYSMLVFPYGAQYIGLVQVFHSRPDAGYLDIELAVSRDSIHFTRVAQGEPFLPVGPIGSWDRFNQSLANNPPVVEGDELRFYYGGRTYRHSPYDGPDRGRRAGGVGMATILRDRFVALESSFVGGQIVTKPLRLADGKLHLNAKADFGDIAVEALDLTGNLLARSQPITLDGLSVAVEWEKGKAPPTNVPIVLRFTLRNARLFALWCS